MLGYGLRLFSDATRAFPPVVLLKDCLRLDDVPPVNLDRNSLRLMTIVIRLIPVGGSYTLFDDDIDYIIHRHRNLGGSQNVRITSLFDKQ